MFGSVTTEEDNMKYSCTLGKNDTLFSLPCYSWRLAARGLKRSAMGGGVAFIHPDEAPSELPLGSKQPRQDLAQTE